MTRGTWVRVSSMTTMKRKRDGSVLGMSPSAIGLRPRAARAHPNTMKPTLHLAVLAGLGAAFSDPHTWVQAAAAAAAIIHALAALRATQRGRKDSERAQRAAVTRKRAQGQTGAKPAGPQ